MSDLGDAIRVMNAKDVRDAIADFADACAALIINAGSENAEIVASRATYGSLMERLNAMQNGGPKGAYNTLADLQAYHPTDDGNIYLVYTGDVGYIYAWNGTTWANTYIKYTSDGIADGSVGEMQLDSNVLYKLNGILEFLTTVYSKLSNTLNDSATLNDDGLIKLIYCKNNATLDIDKVYLNNNSLQQLLPLEYIQNDTLYSLYKKFNYSSLDIVNATIVAAADNLSARVQVIPADYSSYNKDINTYCIISESSKFVAEKQANFSTNSANDWIGMHQTYGIGINVQKTEVEGAGFTFDTAGIKAYAKTLDDFVFYARKLNYTNTQYNFAVMVHAGDLTITKKATTDITLEYYTKPDSTTETTITKQSDFTTYQSIVKNPLSNAPYDNVPVGIYISFDKGKCKSAKCIEVYKQTFVTAGNGDTYPSFTKIDFQWEDDVNPHDNDINLGSYADGSLRAGTIWVKDSFAVDEEHTYMIKVYEEEQENTYTQEVTYAVVDSADYTRTETLTANGVILTFNKGNGMHLKNFSVDGVLRVNSSISGFITSIKNNAYSDLNTTRTDVNLESFEAVGDGVVFMDYIVKYNFVYNNKITGITKFRLYFNGQFDIDAKIKVIDNLAAGILNGINFKCLWDLQDSGSTQKYNWDGITDGTVTPIIGQFKDVQFIPEFPDTNTYSLNRYVDVNTSSNYNRLYALWQQTSPNTIAIPTGTYWSVRILFSVKDFTYADYQNQSNRRMNPIRGRASKGNVFDLTTQIKEQCKTYITGIKAFNDTVINPGTGKSMFTGANVLQDLLFMELTGIDTWDTINSNYDYCINTLYGGGINNGFWNKFASETSDSGIEYMGRNTAFLPYLRNKYIELNNTSKITELTNLIHALADFYVANEIYSGGSGKMCLGHNSQSSNNTNAQSAAMKALKESLDLEANTTRQDCFDRIKSNFDALRLYDTYIPHLQGNGVVTSPQFHYEMFPLMDYAICVNKNEWGFNITSRAYEGSAPSGAMRELGFNVAQNRRGLATTYLYVVGLLSKTGSISDLEQAKIVFDYLISKLYPLGFHEYPIDQWGNNDSYLYNATIESQVLGEIYYNL